jgi:formate dehydrogenase subunit delta
VSGDKIHKLVRMANQIADYFKVMPEAEALKGASDHLRAFWTPKMLAEIVAHFDNGGEGLNPLASRVIDDLHRASGKPREIATG